MPSSLHRLVASSLVLAALVAGCSSTSSGAGDTCSPGDADGQNGGTTVLSVTVDDTTFAPTILKAQNLSNVTVTLKNNGTKPHGFTIYCLPTPNSNGCPQTSCFTNATIAPVAPGASASATFTTPNPEGIYDFHSSAPGDPAAVAADGGANALSGQFIVQ
jgi:hypothetical protein